MEEIKELYTNYGNYDYIGEEISQSEHMIQAAMLAEKDNHSDEVVIANFLHDIGHLIGIKKKLKSDDFGVINHEQIAYNYLIQNGFKYPIPELVYNHVNAKRYLTFKYPEYYDKLTHASKNTLIKQGGQMTPAEAYHFEKDPLFNLSLTMRKYDEQAKVKNMRMTSITHYFTKILKYLKK
jgi:2-amino-1-hydroxyethylphosphonate dioxygenase (glycine-forming)